MTKGKARKQTKGKPLFGGLPWFIWLGIGLTIVAIVVLVRISPTDQTASTNSGEPKVAIIDQLYALDQPNQEFIGQVTDNLESYGFKVDLYQGDEVTVDLYRRLPEHGYKLIIFRVHSGLLKVKEVQSGGPTLVITSLFTSERYSTTKYVSEQLNDEIAPAVTREGCPSYFAVLPKFVSSMKGEFDNTAIIVAGCSGLYFNDLAQAFIDKGAAAYLAWDDIVGLNYVDNTTIALIKKLCPEELTIGEAVANTMEEKGPDPDWGAVLKYYPAESGNKTIAELIKH